MPDANLRCLSAGKRKKHMSYENNYYDKPKNSWEGLHPGVRSALIFWVLLLAIALLNSFTGGTSLVFCYPVQVFLYAANGALAAYFALNSGHDAGDLPKIGAIAGLVAWVMPAVYYLIFGLLLGVVTLGMGWLVGAVGWLLCGPIDLAIHAVFAALGAWLYGRFAGGRGDSNAPY